MLALGERTVIGQMKNDARLLLRPQSSQGGEAADVIRAVAASSVRSAALYQASADAGFRGQGRVVATEGLFCFECIIEIE